MTELHRVKQKEAHRFISTTYQWTPQSEQAETLERWPGLIRFLCKPYEPMKDSLEGGPNES